MGGERTPFDSLGPVDVTAEVIVAFETNRKKIPLFEGRELNQLSVLLATLVQVRDERLGDLSFDARNRAIRLAREQLLGSDETIGALAPPIER